jgi:hypothetical protein
VPSKRSLVLLAVLLAACSGGDDGDESTATTDDAGGCPVAASAVGEALGRPVAVEDDGDPQACTYAAQGGDDVGTRVEISVRSLRDEPYGDVVSEVERRAGPTVALGDGDVDGADVGWIVSVGRAVQVGAADGRSLVVVAVTDPLLDAEAAGEVAMALAGEALDG